MRMLPALVLVALSAALVFTGWRAWEEAKAYERVTLTIIEQLDAEARVDAWGRQLLEWLSLGLYEPEQDPVGRLSDLKGMQAAHRADAQIMALGFFALTPFVAVAALGMRRNRGDAIYALLGTAFVALGIGVTAPMLSIEASKSLPLIGETVLQFESKSVLSVIGSLLDSGDALLALLLFGFSVLVPFAKTLLVAGTLFARTHHWSLRGLHLSHAIGKWSMVDVFVVAVLVAFLASNGKGLTNAEIQIGLYFFAGYGLLSLLATQLMRLEIEAESERRSAGGVPGDGRGRSQ